MQKYTNPWFEVSGLGLYIFREWHKNQPLHPVLKDKLGTVLMC